MNQDNRMPNYSELSPVCVFRMLIRNLWMIVTAALVCAMAVSIAVEMVHVPQYRSTMTYAVTSKVSSVTSNRNTAASAEVSAIIAQILQTDVLNERIRESSPELSEFNGTVSATQVGESNLIAVSVQSDSPRISFLAIQALMDVFPEMASYLSKRTVIQVIQNPKVSAYPVNGVNETKLCMIAALAGAAAMCWLLLRSFALRETVQTKRGAKRLLDAPIIAVVGHERKNRSLRSSLRRTNRGLQVFAPSTSYAYTEQINAICSRFEHESITNGHKIFLITGVGENEGKSTIAGNVAAMLAMKGKKVALLDGDLRKPALYRFFDGVYQSELPLNKLLELPYSRENLLKCMVCHPRLGLYMLFAMGSKARAPELLTGRAMAMILQQVQVFDYVIVDTPPMGFFADTEVLADQVDATVLVVRQDATPAQDINDAADALRNADSAFLGCILNDMRESAFDAYGYGYGYGKKYGYGYGYGYGAKNEKHRSKRSS